ncbi:helix-turn-helix domain-containing protein [Streptomyces sp. NBC_00328]|uniref:helix-turn-helix domain-containing protein n=1 Tax=Streptomyces sp. NBC_00328 TaxID=2903646 RepID=UPI002E2DC6A1|nr:helix-turn-helix domain-containing protein [Streptomyces sp. NBC_00328]
MLAAAPGADPGAEGAEGSGPSGQPALARALDEIGRSKVYDLIRSRRLASIKIDGARRIPADAVRDFILGRIEKAA